VRARVTSADVYDLEAEVSSPSAEIAR